jgi:hypothetical protein
MGILFEEPNLDISGVDSDFYGQETYKRKLAKYKREMKKTRRRKRKRKRRRRRKRR